VLDGLIINRLFATFYGARLPKIMKISGHYVEVMNEEKVSRF